MNKFLIYILLSCALLSSCMNNGKGVCREYESLTLHSEVLGRDVPYSVVLPAGWRADDGKEWPVLYLFHCIGGDATTGIEYCDITHKLDSLNRRGEVPPMIVVMPDVFLSYCADTYDGSFRYETMLMEELIPKVESDWHGNGQRFTLGFSMGGFGAMTVAMRHTDKFLGVAALSPSVRTDAQYASEEPQKAWEDQWGRIFGGVGLTGEDRITDYYKSYCPIHLAQNAALDGFKIFIDTGNREGGSLAESNECLHAALSLRGIPHVWRVRDGGHDFAFWRQALPDALRFAGCAFTGREYKAKAMTEPARKHCPVSPTELGGARVYIPALDYLSRRSFPAVYVYGADKAQEKDIMEYYTAMYSCGAATAVAFCFTDAAIEPADVEAACPVLRPSQRMRSAICFGSAAHSVQVMMCAENLFTNVVFVEPSGTMDPEEFASEIKEQRRYPKLILASGAACSSYAEAAALHVAFKNACLSHFHYAYEEGSGEVLWRFPDWMSIINYKFHD